MMYQLGLLLILAGLVKSQDPTVNEEATAAVSSCEQLWQPSPVISDDT